MFPPVRFTREQVRIIKHSEFQITRICKADVAFTCKIFLFFLCKSVGLSFIVNQDVGQFGIASFVVSVFTKKITFLVVFQEDKYKDLGKKCLEDAWNILHHADWKFEKKNSAGDTVHSLALPKIGKVFKLTVSKKTFTHKNIFGRSLINWEILNFVSWCFISKCVISMKNTTK